MATVLQHMDQQIAVPDRDQCCDTVIGGEIYITATIPHIGERLYEALGEVRIQPTRLERTAGASSAGRLWIVETARPIRAIMTFANRCSVDPFELFCSHCNMSVNIVEKSRGYTHLLTGAVVIGMPEKNLSTGEVSGMEIVAGSYVVTESRAMIPVCAIPERDEGRPR